MYSVKRRKTKSVTVGNKVIGGNAPVSLQSMTNTDTRDISSTIDQIKRLEEAGCQIIRCAVPDTEAAQALKEIKKNINIPLVADIHFDYRLAILSAENGADKIRINPGNIGSHDRIKKVADCLKERGIPVRIGVNGSGSLEKAMAEKYGNTSEAMVQSALAQIKLLEDMDFGNIIISLKHSDVVKTVNAYKGLAEKTNYPLHLGVTEAGTLFNSSIRTSLAFGALLSCGIGDTLRVSVTGDPTDEIRVGLEILNSMGLEKSGVRIISCPTCGRCCVDLIHTANMVEERMRDIKKSITIAVMGCGVNGPGEAKEADFGLAGGKGEFLLFKKGEVTGKVKQEDAVDALYDMATGGEPS